MSVLTPIRVLTCAAALACGWPAGLEAQALKTAELGTCQLQSGVRLSPCTIGYRTLGTLNARRDNAILIPTWAGGTSAEAVEFFVPLVDTASFYVVVVDALSNGVSTSPTTSPTQGGASYPRVTIGDMVATQYRLVTDVMHLDQLYAVVGASMGGMQTFEWMVAHPNFFRKAVPLIGSPKLGRYDIVLWQTRLRLLDWIRDCRCAEAASALAGLSLLVGSSPERVQAPTGEVAVRAALDTVARATMSREGEWTFDAAGHAHAMIAHDVSRAFGNDMAAAAARVRAELLSVVVASDHVVTPFSAIAFTQLAGGASFVIDNACGHAGIFTCDGHGYQERVRAFLARPE